MAALSILRPGMFTTVQDLGRWGRQSLGVPVGGALDWFSHRLANRMAGNEAEAATLEVTLTGPHVRFESDAAFAVAGAAFHLTLDGRPIGMEQRVEARSGSELKFGERVRGARSYVALAGGLDVPAVLGSRSTHVLTKMGGLDGRALRAGDRLQVGTAVRPGALAAPRVGLRWEHETKLRAVVVDEGLLAQLIGRKFRVSTDSNRMGYRLEGASLASPPAGELISRAVPTGAIQIPPAGSPILLMNDHATTGGYGVAAVVIRADLPMAAQLAPGDWVEFAPCSLAEADAALRQREAALDAA